jgi:hypothetical protein
LPNGKIPDIDQLVSTTAAYVAERRRIFTVAIGPSSDVVRAFVACTLGTEHTSGQVEIAAFHVFLEALPDLNEPGARARLTQADAAVLLLQFLDRASMEVARSLMQALPASVASNCGVVFVYPREERKFKISCDECGQKIWVLETEIGRRGRCPNCMKPMQIPSPPQVIRRHLQIPNTVPVLSVVIGEPALCRGALANLLVRFIALAPQEGSPSAQEFLKRATRAIQLPKIP